jgi:hypothetical protein
MSSMIENCNVSYCQSSWLVLELNPSSDPVPGLDLILTLNQYLPIEVALMSVGREQSLMCDPNTSVQRRNPDSVCSSTSLGNGL